MAKKSCEKCALLKHNLCNNPGKLCKDWVNNQATCRHCIHAESCITLGRKTGNFHFCLNFTKSTTNNDPEIFDDYDEYYKWKEEKDKLKQDKKQQKKKKEKGFIPIISQEKTPVLSPLVKKPLVLPTPSPIETFKDSENPNLWSPLSIIENVIASDYDPQAFALVDERDLPKSHNIISFITDARFLNQPLYPRQYQILLDFFASYCPWCSDTDWIRNKIEVDTDVENIRDRTVLFRDGVCPKCGRTRYEAVEEKLHTIYTTMALAIGQRAGKTSTVWFTSPAIIHEYLQIPNTVKFMKQLEVTEFHATFVGTTYEETFRTVWSPMQKVFLTAPWFKTYHQLLDSESQRLGIELYKIMDSFVAYKYKGIIAYPSGPDYRKLRGKCVTGDTLVSTDKGLIKAANGRNLLGTSIKHLGKSQTIVSYEKQAVKKKVIKLYTENNSTLKVTLDHRIPVLIKDKLVNKFAKDLLDNYVVIQTGGLFPNELKFKKDYNLIKTLNDQVTFPTKMTKELARVIGYLLSSNCNTIDNGYEFVTTSIDSLNDFVSCFKQTFNYDLKVTEDTVGYAAVFYNTDILEFFNYLGLKREYQTKVIPWSIFQSSRDCVINCLAATISLDGGIHISSEHTGIYYSSSNKKLMEGVYQLFRILGYYCNNIQGQIQLPIPESERFLKKDYTRCPWDIRKIDSIFPCTDKKDYAYALIPNTNIYTCSEFNKKFNIKVPESYKHLIDIGIFFNRVTEIKFIGLRDVYDIEVTGDHLFTANGVLVHNTRILGGIDEGAYLTGEGIMMNAWQVYDALDRSFSTLRAASEQLFPRYPWIPSGYGLYTSSTRSKLDFIMGLYKRSKGTDHIYGRRMATWDFNPNMPRDSKFIQAAFAEDPQAAERDYGSNPPFSNDPYIKSPAYIVPLFSNKRNVFSIQRYHYVKDSLGGQTMYPTITFKSHNIPSILSIDMGWKHNSYAMSLLHYMPGYNSDNEDEAAIIGVSGLLEICPKEGIPLNFPHIYDHVISPICEQFNIVVVAVDRWQSIDLQQRIFEDFGIDTVQYSVKYSDFDNHRKRLFSESIVLPKLDGDIEDILSLDKDITTITYNRPVSHLMIQYITSVDTGRTVTKGESEDMTDDILRTVVLGTAIIDNEEYSGLFLSDDYTIAEQPKALGARLGIGSSGGVSSSRSTGVTSVPGLGCVISI